MFRDRAEAGRRLGHELVGTLSGDVRAQHLLVLGLARGGVPVARLVAEALGCPVDVLVVRKVGAPGAPEFAVAAVAEDGTRLLSPNATPAYGSPAALAAALDRALGEARRRAALYREGRALPDPAGRTVVIVDDGLATGLSMACAVRCLRGLDAGRIVVAVPTASSEGIAMLRAEADLVVACEVPDRFLAVGVQYAEFPQVDDEAATIRATA